MTFPKTSEHTLHKETMTAPARMLALPYGDVFATQHSTKQCWNTAQSGLILLSEIGSTMHGVSSDDTGDDIDLMGICIEPPLEVLGLGDFEQYEYRDRKVNERSREGDTDLVVYGFRKWVRLAATGNPTVIMLLFSHPEKHIKYANKFGDLLRKQFPHFLSQQAGHRFLGYLDGQLQRYLDPDRVDSKHATRPELIEKYGWDCYLDDTEFLTRRGWFAYDQITEDDELATINQQSGSVEFQRPTERVEKPYSGPILTSKTFYSDWAVTPNHRMRVAKMNRGAGGINPRRYDAKNAGEWEFRTAANVTTLDWYQQVTAMPRTDEFPVSDPYLALVGAFVSEGCVGHYRKDGSASVLSMCQADGGRLHKTMELAATEFNFRVYRRPARGDNRKPGTVWNLADRTVAADLAKSCGTLSANKRLPSWTLDLSGRQANVLLDALLSGDGTPLRKSTWVYYTISAGLAGDVQALAILAGRRANLLGPYEPQQIYQVLIHDPGDTAYAAFRGRDIKTMMVANRRIVCFTVPNETLITRRNGHVAMHGNTKTGYHALRLAIQGKQLMDDRRIDLPMRDEDREFLLDVRHGQYSREWVIDETHRRIDLLKAAISNSRLPEKPDRSEISGWMTGFQRAWWEDNGL